MNFFNEMWQRMTTADTPTFFKKIRSFGLKLAALSASLLIVPNVPPVLTVIAGYLTTAGGVMAAVGQMACTDTPNTDKK